MGQAHASESQVWVRNHTQKTLHVASTVQSGETWAEGREWTSQQQVIEPGKVGEVMRFTRRKRDVKSSPIFLVNTLTIDGVDDALELRTSLKRSFCSTSMESGLGGLGASELRWGESDIAFTVRREMEQRNMGGFPFCQGGNERIELIIEPDHPLPVAPKPGPDDLQIMAYNIWYLVGKPRQNSRWEGIVEVVSGNDVVVFSEAFKERYRTLIMDRIRDEYPYMTRVISGNSVMNGGVFVASRWPFEGLEPDSSGLYRAPQYIFSGRECAGEDCWASKGIQYVIIKKNGRNFHLFATHLQSTDPVFRSNNQAFDAMIRQTESVGRWVGEWNISKEEPVLIAGDLNFDGNDAELSTRVLDNMGALMPKRVGPIQHSFMMANPASAAQALDYVLYSRYHRAPTQAEQTILLPAGMLSDHFPVRALYRFGEP